MLCNSTAQYEIDLRNKEEERERKEATIGEMNNKLKQAQTECDEIQESLQESLNKMEETDKRATNVSPPVYHISSCRLIEIWNQAHLCSFQLTEWPWLLD